MLDKPVVVIISVMKISLIGLMMVVMAVLAIVLWMIPATKMIGDWAFRLVPVVTSLWMLTSSVKLWRELTRRSSDEAKVWCLYSVGSVSIVIGSVLFVISDLVERTADFPMFTIIGQLFMMVFLILFMVSMWKVTSLVEWKNRQFKLWIPLSVVAVGFVASTVLTILLRDPGSFLLMPINFFLLLDAAVFFIMWVVVGRTWGGRLSLPYIMMAVACVFISTFFVLLSFRIPANFYSLTDYTQVFFIIANTLQALSVDVRLQIELKLHE